MGKTIDFWSHEAYIIYKQKFNAPLAQLDRACWPTIRKHDTALRLLVFSFFKRTFAEDETTLIPQENDS